MSLAKSSLIFSAGTFLSRILGLLREVVLAAVFGAGAFLDAFLVANRIPNMLRELAAEGALGSSFTKVFSELWEKDEEKARKLLVHLTVFLCLALFLICLLGILLAPLFVKSLLLFDKGEGVSDFYSHTVGLTRILFPFIGFMSLASVFAGALHQKGRFFLSSVAPMALNLGYIFGALVLAYWCKAFFPEWIDEVVAPRELVGLALGVLLGGFGQMMIMFSLVKKSFFSGRNFFSECFGFLSNEKVKKVFLLMGPMVVAASAGQINVFVNTNFATSLVDGSVSALSFAFRLLQLPIGIFAVAIGTATLPLLARSLVTDKSFKSFSQVFERAFELSVWLLTPCFWFLLIYSEELVRFLFERGSFTSESTFVTGNVLFSYAFGVIGYGLVKVLTSTLFALEKVQYAMKVSLFSILTNFILNSYFVRVNGVYGLAFSTAIVMNLNALLLFVGVAFDKRVSVRWWNLLLMTVGSFLAGSLSIPFGGILVNSFVPDFQDGPNTFFITFLQLGIAGLTTVFCFALFYFLYRKLKRVPNE